MKRMITVGLTAAALAVAPGAQAAELTPRQVAKIVKRVVRAELQREGALAPVDGSTTVDHAATADQATTADHSTTAAHATTAGHSTNASQADNADHATTAGHATTADRAASVDHAATAGSARTAETAEVAGTAEFAEGANPVLYAHVSPDGVIDVENSKGFTQANITHPHTGLYCFSGLPVVKGGQITPDVNVPNAHETGQFGLGDDPACGDEAQFIVVIFSPLNRTFEDTAFFLHVYR